jgi:hypothetical protein
MLSRSRCLRGVLLLLWAVVVQAEDPPREPSAAELEEAKAAFAKIEVIHVAHTDPQTKRVEHQFHMHTGIQNADLKKLPNPPFAFTLYLSGTQVTDAGLKELKDLKNLTALDLSGTQVTDVGLKELRDLKNLTTLNLRATKVTAVGLKELRAALPKCRILG